jgi:hypothetical protein
MSYVIAAPEVMTSAAADVAAIGANVNAAHMAAAARTTSVLPAAADEVSAAIASVFANHAQAFQGLAGKAAAFNDQFVQHLAAGAFSYSSIEAAIVPRLEAAILPVVDSLLQPLAPIEFSIGSAIVGAVTPLFNAARDLLVNLFTGPVGAIGVIFFTPLVILFIAFFIASLFYSAFTGTPIFF